MIVAGFRQSLTSRGPPGGSGSSIHGMSNDCIPETSLQFIHNSCPQRQEKRDHGSPGKVPTRRYQHGDSHRELRPIRIPGLRKRTPPCRRAFQAMAYSRFVRFSLELAASGDGVALLEEPEVHQHPAAMQQTARVIMAAVRRGHSGRVDDAQPGTDRRAFGGIHRRGPGETEPLLIGASKRGLEILPLAWPRSAVLSQPDRGGSAMSETRILCEGYHDRAFWKGWLLYLGCSDAAFKPGPGVKARDPWKKPVAGGHFAYHSKSGGFLRVVPFSGKTNVLPEAKARLDLRVTRPLPRLVINIDPDVLTAGSVATGLRLQDVLHFVHAPDRPGGGTNPRWGHRHRRWRIGNLARSLGNRRSHCAGVARSTDP